MDFDIKPRVDVLFNLVGTKSDSWSALESKVSPEYHCGQLAVAFVDGARETTLALTFRTLIHEAPCFSISRASVVHSRLHPCARGVSGYTCSAFRSASLVIHFRCTVPCHGAAVRHGTCSGTKHERAFRVVILTGRHSRCTSRYEEQGDEQRRRRSVR